MGRLRRRRASSPAEALVGGTPPPRKLTTPNLDNEAGATRRPLQFSEFLSNTVARHKSLHCGEDSKMGSVAAEANVRPVL